jgi:tRNA-2-methylthio-N6-dimethylallyladenosine synthase
VGASAAADAFSIVAEATELFEQGYREVTLLGQNVDSYKWQNPENGHVVSFAELLEMTALVHPGLRVRFSTSHPKDMTDEVLHTMARHDNICNYIHLPVQSGNSRVLDLMNRTYDREWYMGRVEAIERILPDCAISSDIITGFCTETEEEHQDTLSMMERANYSMSYMFAYSERPGTPAAKKYQDDVPEEVKKRRLSEVIRLQNQISLRHNLADVGKTFQVLIEGDSKRSDQEFKGRNSQNKMIVFPKRADTHECGWVPTLRPADRWTIPSAKGIASPTQTGQQVASKGMTHLPLGSILADSQMKICGYAWASSSRNRILEIRRCVM